MGTKTHSKARREGGIGAGEACRAFYGGKARRQDERQKVALPSLATQEPEIEIHSRPLSTLKAATKGAQSGFGKIEEKGTPGMSSLGEATPTPPFVDSFARPRRAYCRPHAVHSGRQLHRNADGLRSLPAPWRRTGRCETLRAQQALHRRFSDSQNMSCRPCTCWAGERCVERNQSKRFVEDSTCVAVQGYMKAQLRYASTSPSPFLFSPCLMTRSPGQCQCRSAFLPGRSRVTRQDASGGHFGTARTVCEFSSRRRCRGVAKQGNASTVGLWECEEAKPLACYQYWGRPARPCASVVESSDG